MEKRKLALKKFMSPSEAAVKLEDLARAFRTGKVKVEKDLETLEMVLSDTVEVEITAKEKKNKYNFALELSWFSSSANGDDDILIYDGCKIAEDNPETLAGDPLECVEVEPVKKDEKTLAEAENNEEFLKKSVPDSVPKKPVAKKPVPKKPVAKKPVAGKETSPVKTLTKAKETKVEPIQNTKAD